MLAPIAYRGPDDEAFEEMPGFGVGFRRLAIVDREHGRQPMTTGDGRLTLVCNGEIYDHGSLRDKLSSKGHQFRTKSDSEVVLHAYAQWGPYCAEHLRGIFAFAIWDATARTVFLCRDRSGIKPLFLRAQGDELLFASEAKAILAHPKVPRRLDLVGCFASVEPNAELERSPFLEIQQLGSGTTLTFGPDGVPQTRRYWSYSPTTLPEPGDSEANDIERFREELGRVVKMQLMSDVPLGACLSGGLDSSYVTALASKSQRGFQTFTTVSEGSLDPWFSFVLSRTQNLESHFLRFDPASALADLPRVAWGAEGLFDLGFASRLQLCTFARQRGIEVLLSGQGIDELTGGYDKTHAAMTAAAVQASAEEELFHSSFQKLAGLLARPTDDGEPGPAADHVAALLRRQHADLSHYLLRFEDRMGMLAGVEVRVPFLDHAIVELCARVPPERRRTLFGDKRLVREAAKGIVPDTVRLREKYAFNGNLPTITRALEETGRATEIFALTEDAAVRAKGYFDLDRVRQLRTTRSEQMLDAVLVVHLLDELFVSHFDPLRFANAPSVSVHEVTVDESWMPAEAILFAARTGPRGSATPSLAREITFVGLLHEIARPGGSKSGKLLVVRTSNGDEVLTLLPSELDPALVLTCLRDVDGRRSYIDIATLTAVPLDEMLAVGRFLGEKGWLVHARRP